MFAQATTYDPIFDKFRIKIQIGIEGNEGKLVWSNPGDPNFPQTFEVVLVRPERDDL